MKAVNKKISLFLISMISLLACQAINAAEYTISKASELSNLSLTPGDVVVMTNGTWDNQQLSFKGNGTEDNPITLKAATQGSVILTGDSKLQMSGEYLIVDGLTFQDGDTEGDDVISFRTSSSSLAYNCRVTNTAIIDYNPWDPAEGYKWVSIYGQYNEVDHCSFVGKNHSGALMVIWIGDEANYHHIHHNYFADIPELGENGGETIRIGTSTNSMKDSYATVEHNLFEACDGEIEIISNKSCENIYRYNTFLHCEGMLTLRHGNRCNVYGNFFFGDLDKSSGGVRIIGEDHKVYNNYFQDLVGTGFRSAICLTNGVPDSPLNRYYQVKNPEIINNTIVNCKYPINIGAGVDDELTLAPTNVLFANNVIADYVERTQAAITYEDTPTDITYTNNIIYASKRGSTPSDIDDSDPKLEESDDFYRPESNSPIIGFGDATISYLTLDIEGQSRATSNDAGCDQTGNGSTINAPLSAEDIGGTIGVSYTRNNLGENPIEDTPGDSIEGVKLNITDAIASTEQNEDGKVNLAIHAIDDDFTTRWSGEGIGAYIDLYLEEAATVTGIKVGHYKGDERTVDFHLLAWDATNQGYDTLLANQTSSLTDDDLSIYDFDDVYTDNVRFVGLGYSGGTGTWNSYNEFELWGWNDATNIDGPSLSSQMALYPNPCSGTFYVKNCELGDVNVFSLAGHHVYYQSNITSNTAITLNLNSGIYLVHINSEYDNLVERLILI